MTPDQRQQARALRLQAIVDGDHVHDALGQAALYEHRNGEHVIIFRGERYVARTVGAAIEAAEGKTR